MIGSILALALVAAGFLHMLGAREKAAGLIKGVVVVAVAGPIVLAAVVQSVGQIAAAAPAGGSLAAVVALVLIGAVRFWLRGPGHRQVRQSREIPSAPKTRLDLPALPVADASSEEPR